MSTNDSASGLRRRTTLLLTLRDRPGALESALGVFSRHGVNLTQIESRPAHDGSFDFFVVAAVTPSEPQMAQVLEDLQVAAVNLMLLDDRTVPWFPRHISELDTSASRTLDAGTDLEADHPGFNDPTYRARRAHIDQLARDHRFGAALPRVDYTETEIATWAEVYRKASALFATYACAEYRTALALLERHCGYAPDNIPQSQEVSAFLAARTGFTLRPVAGLLSSRDFLHGLAYRVFFCTQYIRHASQPLYTPEPDVCHELLGHAPMFADSAFADLSQEIGLASLGASDADIERLARCYWHSVEFGLLWEGGSRKAYGAGLLSSFGELAYACDDDHESAETASGRAAPEYRDWHPDDAANQAFPITDYQPVYFVAKSLQDAKTQMQAFCRDLPREFYARYNPATQSVWVDRAVRRSPVVARDTPPDAEPPNH